MWKDGEIRFFIIIAIAVFLLLLIFILFFVIAYYRKQISFSNQQEKLKLHYQQEILQAQLEIQEQTLKTISQEIHDNIGQVLSLAKLNLNRMDISKPEKLQEKIDDSKNLVSKAIQDLRDLSKSLNTDNISSMGIVRSLEYEMDMIRKTGFETRLDINGEQLKLESQKELILFRIVQETLNNIMKHAEASSIFVSLVYEEKNLSIVIKDNGKGFDLTPLSQQTGSAYGLGIRNMHNRANLIGADFKMSSTIGEGTAVLISLPLNNHNS